LIQARTLLPAAGGEPSDAAVIRRHAVKHRNAAVVTGIGGPQSAANFSDDIGRKRESV
jgi:hypothetical protein